jgi:hypothetical protein
VSRIDTHVNARPLAEEIRAMQSCRRSSEL